MEMINLLTGGVGVLFIGKIVMNGRGQLSLSLWYFRPRLTKGWSRTIKQVRPITVLEAEGPWPSPSPYITSRSSGKIKQYWYNFKFIVQSDMMYKNQYLELNI